MISVDFLYYFLHCCIIVLFRTKRMIHSYNHIFRKTFFVAAHTKFISLIRFCHNIFYSSHFTLLVLNQITPIFEWKYLAKGGFFKPLFNDLSQTFESVPAINLTTSFCPFSTLNVHSGNVNGLWVAFFFHLFKKGIFCTI